MKNKKVFMVALSIFSILLLIDTIIASCLYNQSTSINCMLEALIFIGFMYSITGFLVSLYLLLKGERK